MTSCPLLITNSPGMIRVFVYGTLKPGERYYPHYCADKVIAVRPAIAYGNLYALPMGYPAMTIGHRSVQGYVLTFADESIFNALDELEGYNASAPAADNEYDRCLIEAFTPDRH
ncbi:MAG: gamma-glutamylcyclotransferase, partial [Cyanobacteria bacterium]|nr:gamma-glutamylcyclotransferase [Cyanobacteriota bacterium]MDW8203280.1 gamma-glutamylcyclotransferase [Cyanobacteriota bacterium SKYGB_h_bin112]